MRRRVPQFGIRQRHGQAARPRAEQQLELAVGQKRLGRDDPNWPDWLDEIVAEEEEAMSGAQDPSKAHTQAAEHHEEAAKHHRQAAQHHEQGRHDDGKRSSGQAHEQGQQAQKSGAEAHQASQQQK